jgi:hypothetical protein
MSKKKSSITGFHLRERLSRRVFGAGAGAGTRDGLGQSERLAHILSDLRELDGSLTSKEKESLLAMVNSLSVVHGVDVLVTKPDGQTVSLAVASTDTFECVKLKLSEVEGTPNWSIMLFSPEGEVPLPSADLVGTLVNGQTQQEESKASEAKDGGEFKDGELPNSVVELLMLVDSKTLPVQEGLTLWLAGDDLAQNEDLIWQDRSSSECHATRGYFDSAPTIVTEGKNGLPVLRFDRGAGLVGVGNIRLCTLVLVVRWNKPTNLAMLFAKAKNEDFSLRVERGSYREHNGGDGNDWQYQQQGERASCHTPALPWRTAVVPVPVPVPVETRDSSSTSHP